MDSLSHGAAFLRVVFRVFMFAGLALTAGCASYHRKPLIAADFQRLLESRSLDSSEIIENLDDAAYEATDGLSLKEAKLLALYFNPRLRATREAANVQSTSARYAGMWDDPEIDIDALRILDNVEESWISGASLSFTIPISGRLAVIKKLAESEARVSLIEAWSEEQAILRELREAWADWKAASRSLEVSQDLHERLRELVALTNRREELGEMIPAEAVAFRLAEARLRLDVEQVTAETSQARLRILALIGFLPNADVPFSAVESESSKSGFGEIPREVIYERSPSVLLAAARYEVAEERLRLEVRKQYPDLTLGPLYENEEGMNRLGVGFSIPIPILNANKQGIAEADAARDASRAAWEQAVQETFAAIARNDAAFAAAHQRLETLRSTVVPLAEDQIAQARNLADQGEINTLLILEALQAEREALFDLIEAEASVERIIAERYFNLPSLAPSFTLQKDEQE